ncbi:MAG: metal-binding protein [Microcystaceae cyanobacterium]
MPSGRTHDRITFFTLPLISIAAYLLTQKWYVALIVSFAYLFSGLMFGPDLDIYSIQYKRWGLLRWIWNPYQKWITHRSFLSHGLIVGTVIRLFYLFGVFIVFLTPVALLVHFNPYFSINLLNLTNNGLRWNWIIYVTEAIALLLGLELGAMSHSISDYIGSALKKRASKKAKPKKSQKKRKLAKKLKK